MASIGKKELIKRIAKRKKISRGMVKEIIESFLDEIVSELCQDNRLVFRDFGVFETRTRAARIAQNPKTLEHLEVPAKRTVKFKIGARVEASLAKYDPSGRLSVPVQICLPHADPEEDLFLMDQFREGISELLESFGLELDPETQPIEALGSWFAEMVFKTKEKVSPRELEKLYEEMREALRRKTLDFVGAEVLEKRASAIAKVLKQLEYVDEAAIRLGDVLLVKVLIEGRTRVVIENITPSLARELERKPNLMREPVALFRRVEPKVVPTERQLVSQQPDEGYPSSNQDLDVRGPDESNQYYSAEDDLEKVV
ncbi:MAG: HU family DNA-binding protein [Planctomycetota bacterium]|jgi:nucleoid DNA-binding protein